MQLALDPQVQEGTSMSMYEEKDVVGGQQMYKGLQFNEVKPMVGGSPYYVRFATNDLSTEWDWVYGHCLECETGNVYQCECNKEGTPRILNEIETQPFKLGNCPKCSAAGTLGYMCRACGGGKYCRFTSVHSGRSSRPDPITLAEEADRSISIIIPPGQMPRVEAMVELDRPWKKEDEEAYNEPKKLNDRSLLRETMRMENTDPMGNSNRYGRLVFEDEEDYW